MLSREDLRINPDSPVAVYVQLENQIRMAIVSGKAKSGDTLPSIREISEQLDINPNTVTKAYRDLELLNLVTTRRGVGITVADEAEKLCRDAVKAMVRDHLYDAVACCVAAGCTKDEIVEMAGEAIRKGIKPYQQHNRR
jgi:GntR family transcriptional regulator